MNILQDKEALSATLAQREREKEGLLQQIDELRADLDAVADELDRERLQGARNADGTDLEKVRPQCIGWTARC